MSQENITTNAAREKGHAGCEKHHWQNAFPGANMCPYREAAALVRKACKLPFVTGRPFIGFGSPE